MRLIDRILGGPKQGRFGLDDLGWTTLVNTYGSPDQERILPQFEQLGSAVYQANSVIFSLVSRRIDLFAQVTFKFRQLSDKHLFGNTDLTLLERPWPNGTTAELLARMEQDLSLAGNSYIRNAGDRLVRLRPDWTTIVSHVTVDRLDRPLREVVGYLFQPYGDPDLASELYLVDEVAHWIGTTPHPLGNFVGVSWIGAILRELDADMAMTRHRDAFFRNAASPNMVVKYQQKLTPDQRDRVRDSITARYAGSRNAFGTLVLDSGADVTVVGDRMQGSAFTEIQAAGEARMASAAGMSPLIAGLQVPTSNAPNVYSDAMRQFVDTTMRPKWKSVCDALAKFVNVPAGAELWYDTSDIGALRQGELDAAETMSVQASTLNQLIMAGYKADPSVAAVTAGDLAILAGQHSGLTSVQMHAPGEATSHTLHPHTLRPRLPRVELPSAEKSATMELPPGPASASSARAADVSSGAMVALLPSREDAEHLAVSGGEPVHELHVTLAYLGNAADIPQPARDAIIRAVREAVAGEPPIEAHGFAVSAFNPHSLDKEPCVVLGLSGEDLDDVRDRVLRAVTGTLEDNVSVDDTGNVDGHLLPPQHRPYQPHITLEYAPNAHQLVGGFADKVGPVLLDRVRIAFGGETTDIPLKAGESPRADFNPSLHPRRPNGEFGIGGELHDLFNTATKVGDQDTGPDHERLLVIGRSIYGGQFGGLTTTVEKAYPDGGAVFFEGRRLQPIHPHRPRRRIRRPQRADTAPRGARPGLRPHVQQASRAVVPAARREPDRVGR